jgi:hypothetical protein
MREVREGGKPSQVLKARPFGKLIAGSGAPRFARHASLIPFLDWPGGIPGPQSRDPGAPRQSIVRKRRLNRSPERQAWNSYTGAGALWKVEMTVSNV